MPDFSNATALCKDEVTVPKGWGKEEIITGTQNIPS